MGLFDRFKKRLQEAVDDTDINALSTPSDSKEEKVEKSTQEEAIEEEWDNIEEIQEATSGEEEDWEEWDDELNEAPLPVGLSKKERKRIESSKKAEEKQMRGK